MPRLLVERGPDRGKSVTVAAGQQVVVGRDATASLQLADSMCSRRHFLIGSKNGMFGIKDLGSANGTLVNGRRTEGAQKLQFGDSIQIGETLLSWLSDEQHDKRGGIVGQDVGGYRIEQRIGRGAMGTVYRATQLSLGRTVALKVLAADLVKDARFREMFLKEARAAGGLNHPNIIQVYDVGDDDGRYYFSMEFAAKGSVADELQAIKRIEVPRAVRIIRDACGALDYAERKGLVHRDIKPDNLMVMEDDAVKLGDLGLAMSAQELQGEQEGVFGTPHYIAPEQAMGKPIDHRADIYALGATFYRMLSGKTMYTGATVKDILRQQVREPHPPITQHVPDCPEGLRRVLDRMLAKNPAERYQHASEIAADLSDFENLFARKAFSSASVFAAKPPVVRAKKPDIAAEMAQPRKLLAGGIALAALLAAAGGAAWYFGLRQAPEAPLEPVPPIVSTRNDAKSDRVPLTPEQRAANENVRSEITLASYVLSRPVQSADSLKEDIERAERVRRRNHQADDSLLERLDGLIARLNQRLEGLTQGRDQALQEYDEAWREAMQRVNAFMFEAAKEPLADFIAKWSASDDDEIKRIIENAHTTLTQQVPENSRKRMEDFQRVIERHAREAASLATPARAARLRELAAEARAAEEACDEPISRSRLAALADALERDAGELEAQAAADAEQALARALEQTRGRVKALLEEVRADISHGRFEQAATRLREWQTSDADYLRFGDSSEFAEIRADLALRSAQTELIQSALPVLGNALPNVTHQRLRLLDANPWPTHLHEFLGGANVPIRFDWRESSWNLEIHAAVPHRNAPATSFDNREKRAQLAGTLLHLFHEHAPMRDALMQPAQGNPPAIIGVFAWLTELEAHSQAAAFIDYAWERVQQGSPHYNLLREYYAWSLLGRASEAANEGDSEGAARLIARLEQEFADTRANRGRG
jgi:hypothetical protein